MTADLASVVAQVYGDVDGILGHGHEIYVFKRLLDVLSLGFFLPFLEEGGEGVAIDDALRLMVAHCDLSVALHGDLGESLALAVPSGLHIHLLKGNVLGCGSAGEDVVDAQGLVLKIIFETLGSSAHAHHGGHSQQNVVFVLHPINYSRLMIYVC